MLNSYKTSINDLENLKDIYKLAKDEKNEEILLDCLKKLTKLIIPLKKIKLVVFYQVKMTLRYLPRNSCWRGWH